MGLQGTDGRPLYAWIHQQGTTKLPTLYPFTSKTSSIQIYPHPIWRQGPTNRINIHLAPLTKYQIKHVQDIVGTLLYCGRSVDPTIVTDLNAIEFRQAKRT